MNIKKIVAVGITSFAILLGFLAIAPTNMNYEDTGYSAKNALEHLQVISENPHSVFHYEAHEEVRQYLLDTSKEYCGETNVSEHNYLTASNKNPTEGIVYDQAIDLTTINVDAEYDVRNVLATIPGESPTGMLLVAHYDSRGHMTRNGELAHSYGAGDDGYGVVTLLEVMHQIKKSKEPLKNSLYFLFADAEETELYGSLLESKNQDLMDKVNFVINVEGRGMNGASYMFETSKKNNKVIDLYRHASDKVTYSVAPAAYSVMTNYTDFMNFTAIGKPGLNFATLNDINDYHVPHDNYGNVNPASLQHYGSQILPVVEEYVSNAKYQDMEYFLGTHDMVFFNSLPGFFIIYDDYIAITIGAIVLVALGLFIFFKAKKKNFKVKEFFKQGSIMLGGLLISILSGYILSLIVARLEGYPWSLVNVRSNSSNLVLTGLILAIFTLTYLFLKKKSADKEQLKYIILSSVILNGLLSLVTSIALSGASFIFMLPSLFGIIYLFIAEFVEKAIYKRVAYYVSLFILVLIFVPLVTSLLFALTIGGALALALIAYLPIITLVPMELIEQGEDVIAIEE